jgi:hypothetical protein
VIGRVREVLLAPSRAALAYWHGDYLAIDRDEDIVRLAEVGVAAPRARKG